MKRFFVLLSLVALSLACRPTHAASATITAPTAGGANLHCIVPITATYTTASGEQVFLGTGIRIIITDNTGYSVNQGMSWGGGSASYSWDTSQTKNGQVTLRVDVPYTNAQGAALVAPSPIVTVTVQNGFLLTNASCVATVQLPANGATLIANNQPFTMTSTHTVVWTRYDDCKAYMASYRFLHKTTFPPSQQLNVVADDTGQYPLPKQTGPCPYTKEESNVYTAGGPAPAVYQNNAVTYGMASNSDSTLAHAADGVSSWNMNPVPKQ